MMMTSTTALFNKNLCKLLSEYKESTEFDLNIGSSLVS